MNTPEEKPAALASLLEAIAEPTRLRILNLLQVKDLCVCELQDALGLTEPLVSRHLARLRFANLVGATREGTRMVYHLTRADSPTTIIMQRFLTDIFTKEPSLQREREKFERMSRKHRKRAA